MDLRAHRSQAIKPQRFSLRGTHRYPLRCALSSPYESTGPKENSSHKKEHTRREGQRQRGLPSLRRRPGPRRRAPEFFSPEFFSWQPRLRASAPGGASRDSAGGRRRPRTAPPPLASPLPGRPRRPALARQTPASSHGSPPLPANLARQACSRTAPSPEAGHPRLAIRYPPRLATRYPLARGRPSTLPPTLPPVPALTPTRGGPWRGYAVAPVSGRPRASGRGRPRAPPPVHSALPAARYSRARALPRAALVSPSANT